MASRLAAYLGSELRGQLLKRQGDLLVIDRVSRGRAPKEIRVEPKRAEPRDTLELLTNILVPGHSVPITGEVCYSRSSARLAVA